MRGNRSLLVVLILAAAAIAAVLWLNAPESDAVPGAPKPSETAAAGAGAPLEETAPPPASPVRESVAATDAPDSDPPPTPPRPRPEELWGRVVTADSGAPVAGAEVRLQHRDADEFRSLDLDYGAHVDELARTASGADGRFRFGVTRAREHRLHVRADGFAPTTMLNCTGGSEVVVEMSRGATVEGIVRSDGAGLANIPVRIAVRGESLELAAGVTDRDGSFRFAGLQPSTAFVQVRPASHGEEWKSVDLVAGEVHHVEVDLVAGKTLNGRIIDAATRAPVVSAEVSDSWTFGRLAQSGTDGTFVLGGIEDGSFVEVHVRAAGYATMSRNLTGAADKPVEFALVRGGEVTGKFVRPDGSAPEGVYAAAGASYMAGMGVQSTDWIRANVRADGLFVLTGLRPDQHYWLYARGRGYGSRVYALPRRLSAGERIDVGDVVLHPAGGIEGRVVDDAGQPMAHAAVSIRGTNVDSAAWLEGGAQPTHVFQFEGHSAKTDRRGQFRFTSLAAGSYHLSVRPRRRERATELEVTVSDGAVREDVEIVVPVGATIEGVLSYSDGRALGDEASELRLTAWSEGGASSHARVARGGRFRFTGLREDKYVISMRRGPTGFALRPRREVTTGTSDLELLLEPAAVLEGRVVDAEGHGIAARVWARYSPSVTNGVALGSSDEDGVFRLEVPADFHGSVRAMKTTQGILPLQTRVDDVTAGQKGIVLELKPPDHGRR